MARSQNNGETTVEVHIDTPLYILVAIVYKNVKHCAKMKVHCCFTVIFRYQFANVFNENVFNANVFLKRDISRVPL